MNPEHTPEIQDIPPELLSSAQQAREELLETIAETNDELLDKYLSDKPIENSEWLAALRQATIETRLFPVLLGASLRNVGVQPLLDAIIDFLPSPEDLSDIQGVLPDSTTVTHRKLNNNEPLSALVFKIVTDPYAGRLAYVRVYSGELKTGAAVLNATRGHKERVGRLVRVFADRKEEIDKVPAGEIDAVLSMKKLYTGDTLCDPDHPILLEAIQFPNPVISIALEPASNKDKDEIGKALAQLSEEDPTFIVHTDEDTGQTILSGMGELHLEILVDRIQREHNVQVCTGKPQVNYKETITLAVKKVEGRYVHQSGGRGQYGHVMIDVVPGERGSGIQIHNHIKGGVIPSEFIPAVKKGIQEAANSGLMGGLSITDVDITLIDGSYHHVDSSELAFKNAGSMAFKHAVTQAGPTLLEPICKLEIVTPEEFLGDVLGQLNAKRCAIDGTQLLLDGTQTIHGFVPLSEMFGYATNLRSITQGRAMFTIEFDHFDCVPDKIKNTLLGNQSDSFKPPERRVRH